MHWMLIVYLIHWTEDTRVVLRETTRNAATCEAAGKKIAADLERWYEGTSSITMHAGYVCVQTP